MRHSIHNLARFEVAHWLAGVFVGMLCLLAGLSAASAQLKTQTTTNEPKKQTATYDQKRKEANDISVAIIVSGLQCTCARFAEDMRNVVNDLRPDGNPRLARTRRRRPTESQRCPIPERDGYGHRGPG